MTGPGQKKKAKLPSAAIPETRKIACQVAKEARTIVKL